MKKAGAAPSEPAKRVLTDHHPLRADRVDFSSRLQLRNGGH